MTNEQAGGPIPDYLALEAPPRCIEHGCYMERRALSHQTKEQKWCGVWYDCQESQCKITTLIPSPELREAYKKAGKSI
jgi:hypothetical protein